MTDDVRVHSFFGPSYAAFWLQQATQRPSVFFEVPPELCPKKCDDAALPDAIESDTSWGERKTVYSVKLGF